MSSRKGTETFTGGESQKSSSTLSKTKQKKASNASDSPPGPINSTKKSVKKSTLYQKTLKTDQKNIKTAKVIKKNEKETEDSDEKKDLVKKSAKPKLKEKLTAKIVKKPVVKKRKNSSSAGNSEKCDKLLKTKKTIKKSEDKEEKKPKDKVQKDKKVKDVKKKPIPKPTKKIVEEVNSIKSRVEIKPDKKDKLRKPKATAKNKVKINSAKKIDDDPAIECMDVVKDEKPDDVALLQVFQLKNGPVCDFDGSVCNTITIRQDNTCIKIKEISVSQLPYSVKTEENEKIEIEKAPVKKELKHNTENQNTEKQNSDQHKTEKLKNEKHKSEKEKKEKQKVEKSATKPVKVEKKKKPLVVDKIKSKGKIKVVAPKIKGRPVAKRPRVASLNAIAKVHCLYENESKSALIDAMAASAAATINSAAKKSKKKSDVEIPARKGKRTSKRTTPGLKSVGRHWDMHDTSSTNSSSGNIY